MASFYNILDYDAEDEREKDPGGPPLANQISAAQFVVGLIESRNIKYALMGGFAMTIRGSPRRTRDVDMIVEATMGQLWNLITPEARLIIPNTRLIDGVIQIFVRTGPGYDECTAAAEIELDLVQCGTKGSPRALENNRELVSLAANSNGHGVAFHVLNLHYMMKTKLRACSDRALARDYHDIAYLIQKYPDQVKELAVRLEEDEIDHFLDGLDKGSRKSCAACLGR